ncbi:BBA14 family lipoprotein [Borreliella garinii]|uniref:BBA14 family lipoprotein n=1 Tax=Borreliella garinii TaxID=29519 RepID=UPI000406ACF4|nr:BBA14 family lipoprotein [Borreliella garinii]
MQKVKTKINFLGPFLLLLVFLSCESIPSLPQKPTLTNKFDDQNLVLDEAELFRYSTSLNVWLLTVKAYASKYYPNEKFPIFENFDPLFDNENGIENANILKKRIEYYKRYISATEPIAFECYKKYSRR